MQMLHIHVSENFDYHFGASCLTCPDVVKALTSQGRQAVCIADADLFALHGTHLKACLGSWLVEVLTVPSGETSKTQITKTLLENQLLEKGYQRDVCLVAFGGGMILDLVGFVAATYLRGVPVVYLPTSLLSMVDACIGGKVGINTPLGKNTIGLVRQPSAVVADLDFLDTLPQVQWISGMAEVLKHALIADAAFLAWLVQHRDALLTRDRVSVSHMLTRSHAIKQQFVSGDVNDQGRRQCLNYGHTFGHALELGSQGRVPHGIAVAHGMVVANHIAVSLGHLRCHDAKQIADHLAAFGLLPAWPSTWLLPWASYWQIMLRDKKNRAGMCRWVLLKRAGEVAGQPSTQAVTHAVWLDACQAWTQTHVTTHAEMAYGTA